jgi:hypothetical protein
MRWRRASHAEGTSTLNENAGLLPAFCFVGECLGCSGCCWSICCAECARWHKDSPAVKLLALLIDRVCTMVERVASAFSKAVWTILILVRLWAAKHFLL